LSAPIIKREGLVITGRIVYLRPLGDEDISDRYLRWLNDPEVSRYTDRSGRKFERQDIIDYVATANCSPDQLLLGIFLKDNDEHIGNTLLRDVDFHNGTGEISNMIGEKDYWGKGVVVDTDKYLIHYAFSVLKLRKIIIGNLAPNRGATFKSSQLGFTLEGQLREHAVMDGRPVNVLRFGLLQREFYEKFPEFYPAP